MKRLLPALVLCALLAACGNNEGSDPVPTQEGDVERSSVAEELTDAPVPFPELFAHMEQNDTGFFVEAFSGFSAPTPLDKPGSVPFKEEELAKYRRFLIFNSDSTRAIDPYSYNHLLVERGGKERLVPGGPDTEVGIVNFTKGERQRLLYFGPSYMLMDARWKGVDTVLFAITEDIAGDKISPEIWEVDLASMTKRVRRYPDTLTVNVESYRNQKLDSTRH